MTILETIQASFEAHRNDEQAVPMAAYMRDQFSFLGIPSPQRKTLTREVFGMLGLLQQPLDAALVRDLWDMPEREYQYLAVGYLERQHKRLLPEHMDLLEHCVITKSWWDTVDALSNTVGALVLKHPETVRRVEVWSTHRNFWLRRVAILHQLKFKDKTDQQRLFTYILRNAHDTEFFIRKAIGWALRQHTYTDPDAVRQFVHDHNQQLSGLSKREAMKALQRRGL
jgi:3-methyladenine DNA glycosylase AlkD